jgi:DNA polymerase/3'-5' exonuclease PolX
MTKRPVPIEAARMKAKMLMHYLEPVCEQISIAGSIRRGKELVGDIEIVATPRMYEPEEKDLFGTVIGDPFDRIDEAIALANKTETFQGTWLKKLNDGDRYLKLHDVFLDVQVDLFLVRPPAEWGPIFAIRTGPATFSKKLVSGLHVRKMKCVKGRVIDRDGETVPCPTEKQFFKLTGFRWKEPEDRR